jgi:hypothetical protein
MRRAGGIDDRIHTTIARRRGTRRVGLAEDLPEEWVDAVCNAAAPDEAVGADDPPAAPDGVTARMAETESIAAHHGARRMRATFAGVGTTRFDVTGTTRAGEKAETLRGPAGMLLKRQTDP